MYFGSPYIVKEFKNLEFPNYFRVELGIANILGSFAIILPMVSGRIKEWAYAGFAITFISATTAHSAVEGVPQAISPLVSLLILVISYVYFNKLKKYNTITGD